ncbi:hypothetical protein [Flavonifractor sp. An92]|nr:hypothetical protein [Flavonifractor sp. An92]
MGLIEQRHDWTTKKTAGFAVLESITQFKGGKSPLQLIGMGWGNGF